MRHQSSVIHDNQNAEATNAPMIDAHNAEGSGWRSVCTFATPDAGAIRASTYAQTDEKPKWEGSVFATLVQRSSKSVHTAHQIVRKKMDPESVAPRKEEG